MQECQLVPWNSQTNRSEKGMWCEFNWIMRQLSMRPSWESSPAWWPTHELLSRALPWSWKEWRPQPHSARFWCSCPCRSLSAPQSVSSSQSRPRCLKSMTQISISKVCAPKCIRFFLIPLSRSNDSFLLMRLLGTFWREKSNPSGFVYISDT